MSRSPHRRFAAAVLVLGVLAGCGSHGDHTVAVAQAADQPVVEHPGGHETTENAAGDSATADVLNFSAQTVGGKAFEGSSVAGRNAVFWFWAPGCSDCAREAPHLLDAQREYGSAVSFVGVPGLGKPAAMKSAVAAMKIGGFTQVADVDGAIWKRFGVVAQPAYAFVTAAGEVDVVKGALGAKGIASRIAALAGK